MNPYLIRYAFTKSTEFTDQCKDVVDLNQPPEVDDEEIDNLEPTVIVPELWRAYYKDQSNRMTKTMRRTIGNK